jgi:hypothetical protein
VVLLSPKQPLLLDLKDFPAPKLLFRSVAKSQLLSSRGDCSRDTL